MAGLLVLIGIIWLIIQLVKDASIKPCPKGTDFKAAVSDRYANNLSSKELTRRIDSGYYVKK